MFHVKTKRKGEFMGRTVKEKAYAKVNLFLDVLGKREDQYHNLEMVMAPLEIHDVLTFTKKDEPGIHITASAFITKNVEDNLVYQAADYLMREENIPHGVEIHIEKNLPLAAGMGGGSADCAATLRGLNKLFRLKKKAEELEKIGERFGADVPYCVHNLLCIARGKGEELLFLKQKLNIPVLLVTPPVRVSTKKVFEALDMREVENVKITGMTNAIYNKNYSLIVKELHNALQPFCFSVYEEARKLHEELEGYNADGYLMSGSGPTFFIMDKNTELLERIQDDYRHSHFTKMTKIL